jgi:multisubunit Na+/H+ antiporter MnhB subunit
MATSSEARDQVRTPPASGLGIAGFVLAWLALFYGPFAAFFVPPVGIALALISPIVCLLDIRWAPQKGRSATWAVRGLGVGVVGVVVACLAAAYVYLA